jgi:hypothetical protein
MNASLGVTHGEERRMRFRGSRLGRVAAAWMRGGVLGAACLLALGVAREAATAPAAAMTTAATATATATTATTAASYQPVSFALLSDFEYEVPDPLDAASNTQKDQVPAKVKALHGKLIAVRGFMLPLDLDQAGVSEFMLNASFDMCYFGAPVAMNEWILVKMKPGKKAKFSHLAFNVSGRFEVGEDVRNGRVLSLYRLEADSAEISQ